MKTHDNNNRRTQEMSKNQGFTLLCAHSAKCATMCGLQEIEKKIYIKYSYPTDAVSFCCARNINNHDEN